MKVLLCQDVKRLGWLGDIVEVSTGYARNYLLPQGMGIVPTEANLRSLAKEAAKGAEQRIQQRKQLEQITAAVEGAEAVVAAKANEQGRLFGSVTEVEIAANLREQGLLPTRPTAGLPSQPSDLPDKSDSRFRGPDSPAEAEGQTSSLPWISFEDGEPKVADSVVQLPEHIKEVGTHQVTLKFAEDLTATVNVVVVPEQENGLKTSDS